MDIYIKAVNFAAEKHRDQRRKNSTNSPYINHPVRVSHLLNSIGGITDIVPLVAALLHDTLEDTKTTFSELVDNFGKEIADVVKEVSDDKSLSKVLRKKLQVEHSKDLSHNAKLVKLADKYKCVLNLRGTNIYVENCLDYVFHQFFSKVSDRKDFYINSPLDKHLISPDILDKELEKYYNII